MLATASTFLIHSVALSNLGSNFDSRFCTFERINSRHWDSGDWDSGRSKNSEGASDAIDSRRLVGMVVWNLGVRLVDMSLSLFVRGCSGLSGVDCVVEGRDWFWLLVIMVGGCLSHFWSNLIIHLATMRIYLLVFGMKLFITMPFQSFIQRGTCLPRDCYAI